jgi:hypothetical protein
MPGQQQRNGELIPLLLHWDVLLPVVKTASQKHAVAAVIPREFCEGVIVTVWRFCIGVLRVDELWVMYSFVVSTKLTYFPIALFFIEDFEDWLPIQVYFIGVINYLPYFIYPNWHISSINAVCK